MLIGEFADNVLERLDYSTLQNKKPDRRNLIVEADAIRSQFLAAGQYGATLVNGQWQYNIGEDLKELPDFLFTSKIVDVLWDINRLRPYSVMPTAFVKFKFKSGIRTIHAQQTNTQLGNDLDFARTDFIEQKAGSSVRFGLLESASLAGGIGWEMEFMTGTNGLVYFNNMAQNQYKKVIITYLIALAGLSEDDVMPMDDNFAEMLISMTVQNFTQQKVYSRDKVEGQ